jgi:putative ABC transport system permease protein
MTFLRLLRRNLLYHWRGNLAVLLGVALGTAVLTGALLVGDSLRGSLRALTLDRLGWVEEAMVPGRFFRAQLATELPLERHSAAILLSGSASQVLDEKARRVSGVTVLGVDASFWGDSPPGSSAFWQSEAAEVVLNETLANALGVKKGDTVTLHLQKADEIPRESLLGKRKAKDVMQALEVKVRQILPDDGLARFTLKPTPEAARNAFVPLRFLQTEFGMSGQANAILAAGTAPKFADELQARLTLADWGLRLRTSKDRALAFVKYLAPNDDEGRLKRARWRGRVPEKLARDAEANEGILTREQVVAFYEKYRPYISLESKQLFLPATVGDGAKAAIAQGAKVRSVFVNLADEVADGAAVQHYVVIGAKQMSGGQPWPANGIVLVDTPVSPWVTKAGGIVTVGYFSPDDHNHLNRQSIQFDVQAVVPMAGELDDPDLTPEFPGITDQPSMASWRNPPFPYNSKLVTKADEDYWTRYRATPRAYVNLEKAQALWGSRFGKLTSMQFYDIPTERLRRDLLAHLKPEQGGFIFQPVRANAEQASGGSSDFGVLFLSFSCFLIAAALLLVGLLVRLNIDRRASEIGLLLAIGWSHGRVRWLLLGEGAVLAALGAAIGLGGALVYGRLMLDLLRANWPGGDSLNFLHLHAEPLSFAYGYLGALAVSMLTLVWATRVLGMLAPRALLAGETTPAGNAASGRGWPWSLGIAGLALLGAAACVIAGMFAKGQEAKAGSFFGSGALLLTACLAGVWIWLRYTGRQCSPRPSLTALGVRNAGRHAVRSVLTVGLLAAATFLIVAVESFHKEADADFLAPTGGSGGFALVAEANVPIFQDLNQPAVRKELGMTGAGFAGVIFYPCRVRGGDDASCLNLYRPLEPRVMGLPMKLLQENRFAFSAAEKVEPGASPWSNLLKDRDDGTIPAALDANTAQWILKKSLGDVVEITGDGGEKVRLRVVAILEESIFQSEILVSDDNFRKLFPRQEGFSFFLVETNGRDLREVQPALETALADQGVRVQTTASRLQAYLAVENTYLATFQALGGLGLVLGAVGLAIILLRGVWERRGELALLRALGFGSARLAWLVLAENLALLVLGLGAGTAAALLSVAPHLAGSGAHVLWLRIGGLLLVVLATGLFAGALAVVTTIRAPLLPALRRE